MRTADPLKHRTGQTCSCEVSDIRPLRARALFGADGMEHRSGRLDGLIRRQTAERDQPTAGLLQAKSNAAGDFGRLLSTYAMSPRRQSQPHCRSSQGAVAAVVWPLQASSRSARRTAGWHWGAGETSASTTSLPMHTQWFSSRRPSPACGEVQARSYGDQRAWPAQVQGRVRSRPRFALRGEVPGLRSARPEARQVSGAAGFQSRCSQMKEALDGRGHERRSCWP